MTIEKLPLSGALLLSGKVHRDDRGFFVERFRSDQWRAVFNQDPEFVQENYSWSKHRVLRGLHLQENPPQAKLVTCVAGAILDVIVDVRFDSPTFGQHVAIELDSENPRWLWVPEGFAHGFTVLSETGAGVLYKVNGYYNPQGERSIVWNDPDLAIAWPTFQPLVSDKDAAAPSFRSFRATHERAPKPR